jgi:transcriptional regulator GlxA family with amidase domain
LQNSGYRQLASDGYKARPEIYSGNPINHVIDHIARNICEELRESELAELSGFTATAFSRAFKQHTGLTFVRYVNRLRIARACELLMTSGDSIADICFQVGFNNLSNFNRHFLALKGLSPSAFRREQRANAHSHLPNGPPGRALTGTPGSRGARRRPTLMSAPP